MNTPVYLDYNATTPLDPRVVERMCRLMREHGGNPSSSHCFGRNSREAVEEARSEAAALLGCDADEVVFTGGGTESNNLAILGALSAAAGSGRDRIVCSAVEHPSVMETCRFAAGAGCRHTVLPVDGTGLVDPDDLRRTAGGDVLLVSVMQANNEVGTLQPVSALAAVALQCGALFHTDAAQSAGKVDVAGTGADLVSLAGHKFYGPKGTGILMVKRGTPLRRIVHGAGHERGLRPGTENVAGIAGLGTACRLAREGLRGSSRRMLESRDLLHSLVLEALGPDRVRLNGHPDRRLPNTLSLAFRGLRADLLIGELREELAVSAGAACHGEGLNISPVLEAMGVPPEWAAGTLRFSTGRGTTDEEVVHAARLVSEAVCRLT